MVRDKVKLLHSRLENAAKRANRDPNEIEVVFVTKQVDPKIIREAYDLGIRDFGENRVQDWLEKKKTLPEDVRWHLIGHLQTNKTKFWIGSTKLIHSLDSNRLLESIDLEARKRNIQVDALIQVNTSGEATKFGTSPEALGDLAGKVVTSSNVRLKGLMTIGPLTDDEKKIRESFRMLRNLFFDMKKKFPKADWKYLSMGMSSDFEIAVEEGSNLLRIGTAVFGERQK